MATVIDELVVSLKLDPTQFNEGQQKAIQQLQGFETQAGQSMRRVGDSMKGFDLLTTAITNPLQAVKRALEDVARGGTAVHTSTVRGFQDVNQARSAVDTASRRSGEALRAGGMTASEGYMAIARAGLVAFAALESVNKAITTTIENSQRLQGLTQAAAAAGLDPRQLYSLQHYAYVASGGTVSNEQVQQQLIQFQQARARFKLYGDYPQQFQVAAGLLGLGTEEAANLSPEQLLQKIQERYQRGGLSTDQLLTVMQDLNLGAFYQPMVQRPGDLQRLLQEGQQMAPTGQQLRDASELNRALAALHDTFGELITDLTGPLTAALTAFIDTLDSLVKELDDYLKGHPKTAQNAAIGAGLLAVPLIGPLLAAGYNWLPSPPADQPVERKWWNPKTWFGGGKSAAPAQQGAAGSAPYENISRAEGTFGAAGINYDDTYNHQATPKPLTDMTISEAQAWAGQHNDAALGGFQEKSGSIGDAIKALNINSSEKFSPENQRRIADWIWNKQGPGAWSGFNVHPDLLPKSNATGAADGNASAVVDHMVALAGPLGPQVREFLRDPSGVISRDPQLGNWCAAFVNAYLDHLGVPHKTDLTARSYLNFGQQIPTEQVQKGDILLNENLAHVGVATGRTRMNNGRFEVEEISSNTLGPNGELLNQPGVRWRSDVTVRRSAELAAAEARNGPSGPSYAGRTSTGAMATGSWYHGGTVSNDNSQTTNTIGPVHVTTGSGDPMMIGGAVRQAMADAVTQANTGTH